MSPAAVEELVVAGEGEPWRALGFTVRDDTLRVGGVTIRLVAGAEGGLLAWSLRGAAGTELDGLPTTLAETTDPGPASPPQHPNRAVGIDHVVAITDDLERTTTALEAAGMDLRRRRELGPPGEGARMAFFRVGEVVLEVVERPEAAGPARFWGLVVVVEDLDACARALGDRLGSVRDAVQPGRRIATARPQAGLSPAVAFMSLRASG
jgi:Glyoxalase/Bleomycin resistance protein/Dioxygenase superfamily